MGGTERLKLLPLAVLLVLVGCQTGWDAPGASQPTAIPSRDRERNIIRRIRTVQSTSVLGNRPAVEIEVFSPRVFPVRNEIVILRIGTREFFLSRYGDEGDTHVLIFTLTREEFLQMSSGEPVVVQYGHGEVPERWDFGRLDKTLLDR